MIAMMTAQKIILRTHRICVIGNEDDRILVNPSITAKPNMAASAKAIAIVDCPVVLVAVGAMVIL